MKTAILTFIVAIIGFSNIMAQSASAEKEARELVSQLITIESQNPGEEYSEPKVVYKSFNDSTVIITYDFIKTTSYGTKTINPIEVIYSITPSERLGGFNIVNQAPSVVYMANELFKQQYAENPNQDETALKDEIFWFTALMFLKEHGHKLD